MARAVRFCGSPTRASPRVARAAAQLTACWRACQEAALAANEVLVRSLGVVRSVCGSTSREHRQFIARAAPREGGDDEPAAEPAAPVS
jgi:hypothetical protein